MRLSAASTPRKLSRLGKSLLEIFGGQRRLRRRQRWSKGSISSYNQVDVVGDKACDDIIKYLAPTLEQYKGCTIIDVHPGACLFSSKLHDFLKPKWHLLMEPEERYFEPFIQPLLDQPGSTYRHTYLAGAHTKRYFDSYRQIHEDPALLPSRPPLPANDPKLRQTDTSLLVIGNLERAYDNRRHQDTASLLFHQMPYSALSNDLFQRRGLVRMLWWIPERLKHHVLPRSPFLRSSLSHGIEMGVEPTEVAGVQSVQDLQDAHSHSRRRAAIYNRMTLDDVAKRMQTAGMAAPKGRELLGVGHDQGVEVTEDSHKSPLRSTAKTTAELASDINRVKRRLAEVRECGQGSRSMRGGAKLLATIEYPQCIPMVERYIEKAKLPKDRGPLLMDLSLRILNLEASYKTLEDTVSPSDKPALEALKPTILHLDNSLHDFALAFSLQQAEAIQDLNEEQLAFYTNPQLTAFERRAYEPLKLSAQDFFPPSNNLSLMDLTPKSRDLGVPDLADRKEGARVCAEMLRSLYATRNRGVVDALNGFAVNAGNDLVPMVPAISDVRRGGRLNPNRVRAKMLSEEMVEGLVHAFFEWPFRPQTWELGVVDAVSGGSDVHGGGEGEGEAAGEEK